jgi:hypothetical protein
MAAYRRNGEEINNNGNNNVSAIIIIKWRMIRKWNAKINDNESWKLVEPSIMCNEENDSNQLNKQ